MGLRKQMIKFYIWASLHGFKMPSISSSAWQSCLSNRNGTSRWWHTGQRFITAVGCDIPDRGLLPLSVVTYRTEVYYRCFIVGYNIFIIIWTRFGFVLLCYVYIIRSFGVTAFSIVNNRIALYRCETNYEIKISFSQYVIMMTLTCM